MHAANIEAGGAACARLAALLTRLPSYYPISPSGSCLDGSHQRLDPFGKLRTRGKGILVNTRRLRAASLH